MKDERRALKELDGAVGLLMKTVREEAGKLGLEVSARGEVVRNEEMKKEIKEKEAVG